jgi:hypothetical protein
MSVPDNIILGDGVFSVGTSSSTATAIALTRGGGKFTVKREFRQIEADGDYGPVKDRIRLVKEVATLMMKNLEIVASAFASYYPMINLTSTTTVHTLSSRAFTAVLSSTDYTFCQWAGYTKTGKAVAIVLNSAVNLEDIDWELQDKEEVINQLTYSGVYVETARNTSSWYVTYAV